MVVGTILRVVTKAVLVTAAVGVINKVIQESQKKESAMSNDVDDKYQVLVSKIKDVVDVFDKSKEKSTPIKTLDAVLDDLLLFLRKNFYINRPVTGPEKIMFTNTINRRREYDCLDPESLKKVEEFIVPVLVVSYLIGDHRLGFDIFENEEWEKFNEYYRKFLV